MVLIRIVDGVRCFYGDEYGYPSDYKGGVDVLQKGGNYVLKLGTKGVVEWDSVEGHGKMYFNQQEYDDEQSFRPSALKLICTREVIELTPAGKATTRALRQPSSEEYWYAPRRAPQNCISGVK
ncbi:hypothetical protein CYMTET_17164 [Cymbomonas tetramitiformis]|uniref:Uncharacterized protein n=1 Tax=Cymbomonas tetramitiformis TaxID=36881 RepID=A0AAE0GAN0_9CHLO|nr:hypothetical protein CYMTET_17164 [Cymbomonas tetramitiformis]